MEMTIDWTCTDPDNFQFGAHIGERKYIFKEFDWFSIFPKELNSLEEAESMPDNWIELVIDLDMTLDSEKENVAETYYGSLEELKEQNGDSWEWVLAECIFEQESGLY